MTRMDWSRAKRHAPERRPDPVAPTDALEKRIAAWAAIMRQLSDGRIRHIANDTHEEAAFRAAAQRELKRRQTPTSGQPTIDNAAPGPIFITDGARPDGSLIVHTFATQADAAAAGYPWAGLTMKPPPKNPST